MGANIFIVICGRNLVNSGLDDGRSMYNAYEGARFDIAHAAEDFDPQLPGQLITQLQSIAGSGGAIAVSTRGRGVRKENYVTSPSPMPRCCVCPLPCCAPPSADDVCRLP